MANWWLPIAQLKVLYRMSKGEKLIFSNDVYKWPDGSRCSGSAKALARKGLIVISVLGVYMEITPTGKNELGYNRGRLQEIK